MLRIYGVCLEMVRGVRPLVEQIALRDGDHARQLRRSSLSVVLNVAEGCGASKGTRRQRYRDAMGSALETLANVQAAEAIGYAAADVDLLDRIDHIVRVLAKLTKPAA